MKVSRLLLVSILSLILSCQMLAFWVSELNIPVASAIVLPTDQDSWTENDALGTWIFHTSYSTNNTMTWTTSDVKEGSYALNLTHGKSDTGMYFRLVFDQDRDVTSYDGIFLWMKITQGSDPPNFFYIHANPTDINWDITNRLKTSNSGDPAQNNATWTRIFIPLMVYDASGTATWSVVRQLYFEITGFGVADGAEILIDNLYFTTFNVAGQTPTTDQLKMMALTYYSMEFGQYVLAYDSVNYTTMYEWLNITDNTLSSTTLEAEVLGQTIFALSMAYDKTKFDFYLDEAEILARWLLQFQEENGLGRGGFHTSYNDVLETWANDMQTIFDGWILAGLSYLHEVTSNTTYKDACDLSRQFLTGIMWNSTYNVFNTVFYNNTQSVNYATGYMAMRDGSGSLGLATYYRFVSQNSTVLDRLNSVLATILNKASYADDMAYITNEWESNGYQLWGMWQAWLATSNTTYRDSFLNVTNICIGTYMKHLSVNGSATRHQSYQYHWGTTGNYQDGWGLHNALPLFYLANDIQARDYFINALELSLFNHLRRSQTSEGGLQRDDSTYSDRQYYGTPAFLLLAFEYYHSNKSTEVYVPASTGKVTNMSYSSTDLTFTVDGSGTTTTYVYAGSRGEPKRVDGVSSWSFDENSKIVTCTVAHASSASVEVSWIVEGTGQYELTVFVRHNGLPYLDAVVTVEGEEKQTDLLGKATFTLHTGEYVVTAIIGEETQNKTVNLTQDRAVGFDFYSKSSPSNIGDVILVIGVCVFLGLVIIPLFWRRR